MNPPQRRSAAVTLRSLSAASILVWTVGSAGCVRAEAPARERSREPVVGLPCEGCEAVFIGLPPTLTAHARIAPAEEPGEALRISGTVFGADGKPASGVIVYAYHTDARGYYPPDESRHGKAAARHGRLRGWAQSDEHGHYGFDTVRPAGYPGTAIPQHIHMHVIEVGRCTYYIDDILFDDDPRLTAAKRGSYALGRGGSGIAVPTKDGDGVWNVRRDILLGKNIPGYPEAP